MPGIKDTTKQKVSIKCPHCDEEFDQDIEVSFYDQDVPDIEVEAV